MSKTRRANPTMLALEPRFMFDAAGVVTAMDAAAGAAPDPATHDQPAHDPATEQMVAALAEEGGPAHGMAENMVLALDGPADNNAPVLDPAQSPALAGISEDASAPMDGSTIGSTLVLALLGGVTDADAGAERGVAVTGVSSQGALWYSIDGGATWTQAPALSESNALLLSSDARLYFQPNANVNGTITDAITFRAWDRTSGSNGGTADTTSNGGSTAFSVATDTASVVIAAVNDAPTIAAPGSIAVTEDVATALTGISFADVDAGANLVTATLSVPSGTLAATSGGGVTVGGTASALTLTGTIAHINAFIAGSNVTFTTAANATADVTLTVVINDNGNTGAGGVRQASTTVTLDVTAVNDAPTIAAPGSIVVTEDVASALTGISFADVDAGLNVVTATLSVPTGSLAATSGGGVTVGGTANALTLTGTIAHINAFIAGSNVTFTTAANATDDVTLTVVINDNGNTGAGGVQQDSTRLTLIVIPVNDAPTITRSPSIGVALNTATALTGISFADVDAYANLVTVTLSVPAGTLAATSGGGVAVGGTATELTLTGTIDGINKFIADSNVTYTTAPDVTVSVALTVRINDNGNTGSGGAMQGGAIVTLRVTDRPVVAIGGGSPSHVEDAGATVIAPNLTITDRDSATLAGATVRITDFVTGDVLSFTDQNGITGNYDAASGVLTLSGIATRGQYEAALRSITYSTSNDNPATGPGNGNRLIEFRVNDGDLESIAGTTQMVMVTNANDAPVLDVTQSPALAGIVEDASAPVNGSTVGSTLVAELLGGVTDVDTGAQRGIAVTGVSSQGALWYSLDGAATWTQAPALSESNALLLSSDARIYFQPNANVDSMITDAITFRAWDQTSGSNGGTADATGNGGTTAFSVATDTASVAITAVNDAPTITAPGSIAVLEDQASALTGISFADVDAGANIVTATLSVPSGTLTATSRGGVTVGGTPNELTLTGTIADINAFIDLVGVIFRTEANAAENVTLTVSINDNGNTGAGGALQDSTTVTLVVVPVNDAPTITAPGSIDVTVNDATALTGISFDDVDAGANLVTATLSVPSGTLAATSGGGVAVGGTASTLTLVGRIADINAFIAASNVTFTTAADAIANVTLTVSINDNGNTGAGGPQQASTTVTITVADRPVIAIGGGSPSHVEDAGATVIAPNLTITDRDSVNLVGATVRITDFVTGDVLSFTDQNGITGNYDVASGVLTLSGIATRGQYEAALRSITYSTSNDNPATGAGNGDRLIEFRVNDGDLESIAGTTQMVMVTNANDAPVLDVTQSPALAGIVEDASAPLNGSTAGSTLVAGLLGGVTDVDTGAQQGVAVTGVNSQGALWYSIDGGATWTQAPALSESNALLLSSDARIYFQPNANVSGTFTDAITFRAWDQTSGSNGGTADITSTGGTSAFSSASDTASITVAAVNDAPGVTAPGSVSVIATIPSALTGIAFEDVDAGADPVLVTLSVGHGTLTASTDNGVTVTGGGTQLTLSGTIPAINAFIAAQGLSYTGAPDALFDQTLNITIDDGGHNGGGGAQQATTSMVIHVASPNAAPTIDAPSTIQITEDLTTVLTGLHIDDVDGDAITVTLSVPIGTLSAASSDTVVVSGDATTLVLTGPAVAIQAYLAAGGVSYTPEANGTADRTLTIAVSDGELSATASVTLDVIPVNDAPVPSGVTVPAIVARVGHAVSFTLPDGLFSDIEDGAALSLSVQNLPSGLTFDPSTRTISGTPMASAAGTRMLTITGTDSEGATASITATISIVPALPLAPTSPEPPLEPRVISAPEVTPSPPPPLVLSVAQPDWIPEPSSFWQSPTAEGSTSGASGFVVMAPSNASQGMQSGVLVQTVPADVTLRVGGPDAVDWFALPERTFVVFGQSRTTVIATLADGRPLPPWIQFDPGKGTFSVKPPAGYSGTLEVRVKVTTDAGQTAAVDFEIRLEDAAATDESVQPQETAALPAGKPSLSEQLRAAGHDGVVTDVTALIESLASGDEVA